ncbi:MAG: RDD family protein [Victivallales bacterium]
MKYIVKGDDGKEYGPVDEETLRKWTEAGRVLPHTQIRNTLIKKWNKATDFDFLKPSFSLQHARVEEEKGGMQKFSEQLDVIFGGRKKTPETLTPYATAFKNKYIPAPASLSLRMLSALFDFIVILAYAFILMVYFSFSVPMKAPEQPKPLDAAAQQEAKAPDAAAQPAAPAPAPDAAPAAPAPAAAPEVSPIVTAQVNAAFNKSIYLLVMGVLLYYGISLGVFAQTFGMWFWGIMLSRVDLGEVFLGRAYLFTILTFLLGILSPLFVLFNPFKRALPEILSGTMIIGVAAKPKV